MFEVSPSIVTNVFRLSIGRFGLDICFTAESHAFSKFWGSG